MGFLAFLAEVCGHLLPPQFGTEINMSIRATQEIGQGLYTRTCFEQFNDLLETEPGLLIG
jgi:hypothetical protein